jgi:integrase
LERRSFLNRYIRLDPGEEATLFRWLRRVLWFFVLAFLLLMPFVRGGFFRDQARQKQARQLIAALPRPYKALEALMYGTGMEWSAIAHTKRSDVDVKERTIHAQGTKNTHRNRVVRVTEDSAWNEFYIHLKSLLPNAPLFDVKHDTALDVHHEASKAVGLPKSTLHDWRHTYAVNALKEGVGPAVVKRQLGHAPNSTVVERVYGVWIVDSTDYARKRKNG